MTPRDTDSKAADWSATIGRHEQAAAALTAIEAEVERQTGCPLPPVTVAAQERVARSPFREIWTSRYRGRTLIIEIGWPREPQHGHVPDRGLARGRISLSQNTMLEAQAADELILKHRGAGEAAWYIIKSNQLGEMVTEARLRAYLQTVLTS